MAFGDDLDKILPSYLVQSKKTRLKEALIQFTNDDGRKEIDYTDFYRAYHHSLFMQSDLVKEVRLPVWNDVNAVFDKGYTDAIILSNTCDISPSNEHDLNTKQCLFAPIINLNDYLQALKDEGYDAGKIIQFKNTIQAQLISNLFYLPICHKENIDYIVLLDNVFWFPKSELNSYISDIEDNRIASLSLFGYYLFILKLSYHLCRLPELNEREPQE